MTSIMPTISGTKPQQPLVGIIMGSDSDLPVMQEAAAILQILEVPYEVTIVSAHRTPERMVAYGKEARERGLKVIIAGAGGAAHLPGMVASLTPLPVIGVPVKSRQMNGLDSLLSIVQMPGGIPVATVAINGARNAGLLAARMLALGDETLMARLDHWIHQQTDQVLKKAEALETMGVEAFLEGRQEQ
ncbi:5-(carboxyamino)imidazole ribonucleotide mutase [Anoxynatronum sibiricum]|uniref:N5-carboxyaminoimidazole ribonucleotide mutase n=1 Tax=Anoxynatronum sibiricum TaxID=210623 RepID=A0ABU9VWV6_9CLOT